MLTHSVANVKTGVDESFESICFFVLGLSIHSFNNVCYDSLLVKFCRTSVVKIGAIETITLGLLISILYFDIY